jgi:hypothetical protein
MESLQFSEAPSCQKKKESLPFSEETSSRHMYHLFNIKQLCILLTDCFYGLYMTHSKQRLCT